jgi:hypothetical protein
VKIEELWGKIVDMTNPRRGGYQGILPWTMDALEQRIAQLRALAVMWRNIGAIAQLRALAEQWRGSVSQEYCGDMVKRSKATWLRSPDRVDRFRSRPRRDPPRATGSSSASQVSAIRARTRSFARHTGRSTRMRG